MSPRNALLIILVAIVSVLTLIFSGKLAENVDADEILVVQSPIKGQLVWYTSAGVKWQGFGKTTTYQKRDIYEFEAPVQFNDGGKGVIHGSIQYDMPLDIENLTELHTRFGSAEAIQKQVIEVVTNKVIYMTGPVMSSRESYAEKRNYLINYVQDQIDNGVYQTRQGQQETVDQLTGQTKVVTIAEIVHGPDGRPLRQEQSVVREFGIRAFNFAIKVMDYDDAVEQQIKDQQKIAMDVQTSIADALKAQQRAITVEQQGKADAAAAKWEQEVIKAKQVTEAEARLRVAEFDRQAAAETKQKEILLGEGEARRRELVMSADGALEKKLAAWIEAQRLWADAIKGYQGNWVSTVQMDGSSDQPGGAATDLVNLLTAKTARELGLDISAKSAK
jgi:hypothetical protein